MRTIARNRTSDALSFSAGVSATLSRRWYANFDTSLYEIDATVASAGVAARPRSERIVTTLNLVGASLRAGRDSLNLGLRIDSSNIADTSTVFADWRMPIGDRWQITPRLDLSQRSARDLPQWIYQPSLRVAHFRPNGMRFELEARGRFSDRELPVDDLNAGFFEDGTEQTTDYFVALRWQLDF